MLLLPQLRLALLVHAQRHVREVGQLPVETPAHVVRVAVQRNRPEQPALPVGVLLKQAHSPLLLGISDGDGGRERKRTRSPDA